MLKEAEKAVFCRLSVFAGGWTLEAAEAACADAGDCDATEGTGREMSTRFPIAAWEVLHLLTALTDKSLVIAETVGETVRYRLLETLRQYALDRARESGEDAYWRDRHLQYVLSLVEEARSHLVGSNQTEWLERLEIEHDNVRAALEWSVLTPERAEAGLRLVGVLARFWEVRGYLSEGRERMSRALAAGARCGTAARELALKGAGVLEYHQGDYPAARAHLEASLALGRELGDPSRVANSLNNLGNIAFEQDDIEAAQALFEETLAIRREQGEQNGIAASLNNLGNLACHRHDFAVAQSLFEESLTIKRRLGDQRGIAGTLRVRKFITSAFGV